MAISRDFGLDRKRPERDHLLGICDPTNASILYLIDGPILNPKIKTTIARMRGDPKRDAFL